MMLIAFFICFNSLVFSRCPVGANHTIMFLKFLKLRSLSLRYFTCSVDVWNLRKLLKDTTSSFVHVKTRFMARRKVPTFRIFLLNKDLILHTNIVVQSLMAGNKHVKNLSFYQCKKFLVSCFFVCKIIKS